MGDPARVFWRRMAFPILVALLVHGVGLWSGFAADDLTDIVHHPVVGGGGSLADLLHYNFMGNPLGEGPNTLRPLVTLLFAVQWRIGGGSPVVFHAFSILWLCAATAALGALLRRCVRPTTAVLGATLFATLAIHVDAVGLVSNSAETIALVFMLLALPAVEDRQPVRASLFTLAALLSKESAVLLPVLAAWWLFATGGGALLRTRARPLIAVTLVTVSFVIVRSQLLPFGIAGVILPVDNGLLGAPLAARLWMPFVLVGHYLHLTLAPVGLSVDYAYGALPVDADLTRLHGWLGVALVGALVVAIVRRRGRPAAAAAGALGMTLALACNTVVLLPALFGERLFMVPSAFLVVLVCCLGEEIELRDAVRRLVAVACVLVLALQGVLAALRTRECRDDRALFAAQVRTQPASVKGHYHFARFLAEAGELDEAIWQLGLASYGRKYYPAPFTPPALDDQPVEDRLRALPGLLAPGTAPAVFWRAFAGFTRKELGQAAGARADELARP